MNYLNIPTPLTPHPLNHLDPIPGLRVSVLVPTFNRATYLAQCLDSLLAQTMPALEIIVIDDGSEDGTAELLKLYRPPVRAIRKENGGKPAAVNLGLSLAQGNLIWIFDDDDVALPDAIASRVEVLRCRPDAGFVYSPHFYGTDGADGTIQQGRLHGLPNHAADSFLFELMKGCYFHLNTVLARTDAYRTLGGFDAQLLSSEDYDMQLRLARAYPAAYCPQPSFIFRQHGGLRGAKAIRYSVDQRAKVFRSFDQRVGHKIRANFALGDYLVPRRVHVTDLAAQRQALLSRMTVMASKGCLLEMMDDLRSVMALLPSDRPPPEAARKAVSQAICTGYAANAIEEHWDDFLSMLQALPSSRAGRSLAWSIAAGLLRLARVYPGPASLRWLRARRVVRVAMLGMLPNRATP